MTARPRTITISRHYVKMATSYDTAPEEEHHCLQLRDWMEQSYIYKEQLK